MASAKEHLAKGERNAAVIELKNVLQQAPDNGEARLMLGQVLFDAGDYVSAEKELSRALELKQPQEKVLPLYLPTLLALGKYGELVKEIEKYKLFDPKAVATTQTAAGDAFRALGNVGRAREAYAAATVAVPGYPRAQLGSAIIIAVEGQLDEALRQTDEIIAADPKLAEARDFRAQLLLAKGDRAGAKKALEEAIAANDRFLPARLSLITLLMDDRDFDGAAKLIESTRKVAPADLRVTYRDAQLAYRRGEMERARQQIQQVLKYLPDDALALLLAGAIDFQTKQYAAAEANLRKVVATAPNHTGARRLLVQTYLRMGQPAKAREALQPLVERGMPTDPRLQLLAGETYLANGDAKRAAEFYQAATKGAEAQQVVARTRLGQIALATGRSEEGFKELEAASELDAGTYQADLALIAGHLRRNEIDKAMAAVKVLEKKQPTNPLTFQMYGLVHLAKRDFDAARKSFEKALELQPTYLLAARSLAALDLAQQKPDDALKRYEAMIVREPNNEQIYLALADVQARSGASIEDTVATRRRAVKANPQAPDARAALITTLLWAGETKEALVAAQDALAAVPSNPRVLALAASAQEAAGEVNQAIGSYNKLASLLPQDVQPLYRLAALYVRQKATDRAIETLRRVQKIAPQERDVVPQLIQLYIAEHRYDDALNEARALRMREPNFADGYAYEADVYLSQGKFGDAERLYREALKRNPKANAVAVKLHGTLLTAGKKADADAWAKKWMAENPKDAAMRVYLGERELRAGNLKAAAAQYQAAIAAQPNDALALNNLAWIGGELNDPKALEYAERAVKLAPANASCLDTYGMLLVKNGEVEKGLPYLERAVKVAPARSDLRLNYAKALIKAGRKDSARTELEALAKVTENFPGKGEVPGLLKGL